ESVFSPFSIFAINAGSLLAILLTPILRGRVKCFGSEYCFPLAFGVPGVLMLLAFILFLAGWKYYKIVPPAKGNVVFSVICCICYAAREKLRNVMRGQHKVEHWLDYAAPKYSNQFLPGVKSLVAVSVLFGPVILFWALFDQQGSTWVLQARRMNGRIGSLMILPDQMNTLNPLIVLITVPIFEAWIYPIVQRICKVTPLRKMAAGGCLAALAFVMAGLLQLEVNKTMEPHPEHGKVILQLIGNSSYTYEINGTELTYGKTDFPEGLYTVTSSSIENAQSQHLDIRPALISSPEYVLKIGPGNCSVTDCPYNYTIYAEAGGAHVIYIADNAIDIYTVVRPNTVNILWQLPQFFVITVGEVLFSVTGLEFSYSQAPPNMKSVLQAIWLMTVFLGNVIDMLISGSHIVAEPATEFFVYAFMT
ncbi:POT family protein, partial [Wuchereria bancrofti]